MSLGTTQLDKMEEEAHSPDDDLSTLMVDDFGQSIVDQSEILYEFQTAQNAEEVNRILAEIISDYDCNQLPASKKGYLFTWIIRGLILFYCHAKLLSLLNFQGHSLMHSPETYHDDFKLQS